jgi:hypothetical protein
MWLLRLYKFYIITDSIEPSPSWEATSSWAPQELAAGPCAEPNESSSYHPILFLLDPFLAYFSYFEKIKGGLWDHHAVSLCLSPPIF